MGIIRYISNDEVGKYTAIPQLFREKEVPVAPIFTPRARAASL
jgi:hypothetical protein